MVLGTIDNLTYFPQGKNSGEYYSLLRLSGGSARIYQFNHQLKELTIRLNVYLNL